MVILLAGPPGGLAAKELYRALSDEDAARYEAIFDLQEKGDWRRADHLIADIEDRRLMGYVLHQRYMHPRAYNSTFAELTSWLRAFGDQPGAERIYRLALRKRPAGAEPPPLPTSPEFVLPPLESAFDWRERPRRSASQERAARKLKAQFSRNIRNTRLSVTERLLEGGQGRSLLSDLERDEVRLDLAVAWYRYGDDAKALELAEAVAASNGKNLPSAAWWAGLASWRQRDYARAVPHFEAVAQSEGLSEWIRTGGAYWAARAHLKLKHPEQMSLWLREAAAFPRTFYGLLALRALGLDTRTVFAQPTPPVYDGAALAEAAPIGRALALVQVGEAEKAKAEFLAYDGWENPQKADSLLVLAEQAELPALAYQMGRRMSRSAFAEQEPGLVNRALYPIPHWQPLGGFRLDRALIYGFMRQESGFQPRARSGDGARGLMQVLPSTASYITGDRRYRRQKAERLYDPLVSIRIGETYLIYLMRHETVQHDLFRLAAAYNGGPGNLGKWLKEVKYLDDPLLFIESIPARETRLFVERVMANLWIYRSRLGQDTPSLEAVAAGRWPRYQSVDGSQQQAKGYVTD